MTSGRWVICSLALMPTILSAQTDPESLRNYAEQGKRADEEITRLSDEIYREAKASCYVAVPAPALCHCIMNELGLGVSFQHYVIIRTLLTVAEKTKFIKDSFGLEDPTATQIIDQTNTAWSKCQRPQE